METNFFVFSVKTFLFSKFHENEAKNDKSNFKNHRKNRLGKLQEKCYILTFLKGNLPSYLQIFFNTS